MVSLLSIKLMEMIRDTNALKYYYPLMDSQWLKTSELESIQEERIRNLLLHCCFNVPYYKREFKKLGIYPGMKMGVNQLSKVPVMTKEIAKNNFNDLKSTNINKWGPRLKSTSGSTGKPFNYFFDRESHSYEWAHIWRGWSNAGYKPGDLYASLSGGSLIPGKVSLKQKVYLRMCRSLYMPSYHLTEENLERYTRILMKNEIKLLYGYPTSIEILARYIKDKKKEISLNGIVTVSECLSTNARKNIINAFNCQVIDTYGCNDGGIYSFECGNKNGFHVGIETCYVEIVDQHGRQVKDGEVGKIVVTNLAMRAMPLLRYFTGDLGAIDRTPCKCGRGLNRIIKLQGRERDYITCKDGRKVHGAFFNHFQPFYETNWLERFQIYQPDINNIILRLKVKRNPDEREIAPIIENLKKGLGDMKVNIEYVDEMKLSSSGKFCVVISDLYHNEEDILEYDDKQTAMV